MMMAEVNELMKIAQKKTTAAERHFDTAVIYERRADVALGTLKIHLSIHHGNPFHTPHSPQYIYKG